MSPDTLISIRGATLTVRRARELGLLSADDLAALGKPTELDAARAHMRGTVARISSGPKSQRRRSRTRASGRVCAMCCGPLAAVTYTSPHGPCCRDCHDVQTEAGA